MGLCECGGQTVEDGTVIFSITEERRLQYGGPAWIHPDGQQVPIAKIKVTKDNNAVFDYDYQSMIIHQHSS